MISSIIWLIMVERGFINPEHAPWKVYIPVVIIEILVYIVSLPKLCDWIEAKKESKNGEER